MDSPIRSAMSSIHGLGRESTALILSVFFKKKLKLHERNTEDEKAPWPSAPL
jgi:hypothetical protein